MCLSRRPRKCGRNFRGRGFEIIGVASFDEWEYEREILELTKSLGLCHAIEFTGFRADAGDLIARLDVVVHASIIGEPFGQVVIEGMAAGKPVVATDGGGVPEIVLQGVTRVVGANERRGGDGPGDLPVVGESGASRGNGPGGAIWHVVEHFTIESTAEELSVYIEIC